MLEDGASDCDNTFKNTTKSMKALFLLAPLIAMLASCAAPRAIIGDPIEVNEVDPSNVSEGGRKVDESARKIRDANRDASASNTRAQSTSRQLSQAVERAEKLAEGQEELTKELTETRRLVKKSSVELAQTGAALHRAQLETEKLSGIISDHRREIASLEADAQQQASDLRNLVAQNNTLREQAKVGIKAQDKLVIAKDKLTWWRWAAVATWGLIAAVIGIAVLWALVKTQRLTLPF